MQEEVAKSFEDHFSDCRIWFDLEGSDHAPVWADLQLPAPLPKGPRPPPLDARNRQSNTGAHPAGRPTHAHKIGENLC